MTWETRTGQGREAAKKYLQENPEVRDQLEADIRKNFDKLMSGQSRVAARAAGRAVDVSADDFDDSVPAAGEEAPVKPPKIDAD